MELIDFRIPDYKEYEFVQEFQNILKTENINCSQWDVEKGGNEPTTVKIPDYAIERMSEEGLKLLNSFVIK